MILYFGLTAEAGNLCMKLGSDETATEYGEVSIIANGGWNYYNYPITNILASRTKTAIWCLMHSYDATTYRIDATTTAIDGMVM